MINKIILSKVATYNNSAVLETRKKVNLIYGLNGAGKSTISKYLYDPNQARYANCAIKTIGPKEEYEYLVYNTRFVTDNFYLKNRQKGIFTLSKENKEIEEKVEAIQSSIDEYKKKIEFCNSQKLIFKSELGDDKNVDAVWDSSIQEFTAKKAAAEAELKEVRKLVSNVDYAIKNINKRLADVGLDSFSIVRCRDKNESESLYKIVRNGLADAEFDSLSEGEKMMISFLYFVEMCKGASSADGKKRKRIIVIDDPISSLSHIYVYNVARIIAEEFTAWNVVVPKDSSGRRKDSYPYEQVFIFTHNLYFFNELVERNKARRDEIQQLFMISKKNRCSSIQPMKYSEMIGDYQSYWQFINRDDKSARTLIANCMRHIIEYFFGFMENKDLNEIFQKKELQSNEFQSFYRFINRESHSDARNISEIRIFDFDRIATTFRNIFVACGYENHYETMAKLCKISSPL